MSTYCQKIANILYPSPKNREHGQAILTFPPLSIDFMDLEPVTSSSAVSTGDSLPHGLPLRFSNLSIPDPGGRSGSDVLVDTLSSSMLDLATLGPLRRVIRAASQPKIKGDKGKAKMLVSEVEGIVNQVSKHSVIFLDGTKELERTFLWSLESSSVRWEKVVDHRF